MKNLFHAGEFGVADEVLLQIGIERALAPQPRKRALGFLTQFNEGILRLPRHRRLAGRGARRLPDVDVHQFRARANPGVHAARGDEFGLTLGIGGEYFQQVGEVGVGQFVEVTAQQPADVTPRDAAELGEVALVHLATFKSPLQRDGKVAHEREVVSGQWPVASWERKKWKRWDE